jgi:quercetin dioxygenase-like cupin family protein
MQTTTNSQVGHAADKQLFNAAGVHLQFLASPDEVGDAICLIRGTMPPKVVVPLHKHADPERLYVLGGHFKSSARMREQADGLTLASATP